MEEMAAARRADAAQEVHPATEAAGMAARPAVVAQAAVDEILEALVADGVVKCRLLGSCQINVVRCNRNKAIVGTFVNGAIHGLCIIKKT